MIEVFTYIIDRLAHLAPPFLFDAIYSLARRIRLLWYTISLHNELKADILVVLRFFMGLGGLILSFGRHCLHF